MSAASSTLDESIDPLDKQAMQPPLTPVLVILWSRDEDHLVGSCLLPLPTGESTFGRDVGEGTVALVQQQPGNLRRIASTRNPRLSRAQLRLARVDDSLAVENVGRCPLFHQGSERTQCVVRPGETIQLGSQMLLLCTTRPTWMVPDPGGSIPEHPFGLADGHGLVGESLALWQLRQSIAFVARSPGHVLILGPSGSGKELVARALHASSPRAPRPLVSRNAATLPEGLIDAELFGNIRNYPNPGMAERPGLIGQAHQGSLFLDEFAEMPVSAQTHLLRVLDAGDYQRLGDATPRQADVRLIAATNRPREALRDDLAARLLHVITVPPLDARREDIPLLVRHQLRQLAAADASLARFFTADGEPQVDLSLVAALVERSYRTNTRELHGLLWSAIRHSPGAVLMPPPELAVDELTPTSPVSGRPSSSPSWSSSVSSGRPSSSPSWQTDPNAPTPEQIQACLNANNGSIERSWAPLGLSSRHALRRLITKYGLEIRRRAGSIPDEE